MLTVLDNSSLHSRLHRSPDVLGYANQAFAWLERIARNKIAMCLLVTIAAMGLRLALLRSRPIPQPFVADEFSYLLGAETFTSGHITNPMHPMWEHFETLHEIVRPSYTTMYPPGQSLVLALGWRLLGHPWFGVLMSFGLFSFCLCWMLQQWVPPLYALFGTAIMLARISILGYWMNSYWGGALAAVGGCLVFGALPTLARRIRAKEAILASVGLVVLASTRPFEGLIIGATDLLALLIWRRRLDRPFRELLSARCLVPLLLICGSGAVCDGYYNFRITGNALMMPYVVYFREYRIAPPWLLLSERTPPVYRHTSLENSWKDDLAKFRRIKSHPLLNLADMHVVTRFYVSSLFLFTVLLAVMISGSYRLWTAAAICLCLCGTLLIEYAKTPHYVAGGVGLLAVMGVYGLRQIRVAAGAFGPLIVLTLVALLCLEGRAPDKGESWEVRSRDAMSPRMMAEKAALARGGKHLILVRYAPDHIDKSDECIYNSANIDASQIVWAHDMGETKNRELVDYYRGSRKIWLYQPDTDPNTLAPYEVSQ